MALICKKMTRSPLGILQTFTMRYKLCLSGNTVLIRNCRNSFVRFKDRFYPDSLSPLRPITSESVSFTSFCTCVCPVWRCLYVCTCRSWSPEFYEGWIIMMTSYPRGWGSSSHMKICDNHRSTRNFMWFFTPEKNVFTTFISLVPFFPREWATKFRKFRKHGGKKVFRLQLKNHFSG